MDIFLVGLASTSAAEARERFEFPGVDGSVVRDWSSLTDDDTFWGVVVDAPEELFLSGRAELGLEVRGLVPLGLDLPGGWQDVDLAGIVSEFIPEEPPQPLEARVTAHLIGGGATNILIGDGHSCASCGWIDSHAPDCPLRS